MMQGIRLMAAVVIMGLSASVWAETAESFLRYDGRAVDLADATPLYDESHHLRLVDGRLAERIVLYRCPAADGAPFARKRMWIGTDPLRPAFEMRDARLGYVEGLREADGRLTVFYQRDRNSAEESEPLELPEELVADAGFDEYVRKHWDQLLAGDKVSFDFLVPSRLEYLSFKVRWLRAEREAGRAAQVFRLSLSGVLGWFLDGIDVWYADDDRSLLRFDGLSNVRNAEGDNYTARIVFPADRKRTLGADSKDFDTAAAMPLVERCP